LFAGGFIGGWFPPLDVADGVLSSTFAAAILTGPRFQISEFLAAFGAFRGDGLGGVAATFIGAMSKRAADVVGEFLAAGRAGFSHIVLWLLGSTLLTRLGAKAPCTRSLAGELFAACFALFRDLLGCAPTRHRTINLVSVCPRCERRSAMGAWFFNLGLHQKNLLLAKTDALVEGAWLPTEGIENCSRLLAFGQQTAPSTSAF
jgi:hypothetical protein